MESHNLPPLLLYVYSNLPFENAYYRYDLHVPDQAKAPYNHPHTTMKAGFIL